MAQIAYELLRQMDWSRTFEFRAVRLLLTYAGETRIAI
jgi:hypothetical protein